jgi:CHAT domain-containing protein/tetratricopeptide (TPR) repeat protein
MLPDVVVRCWWDLVVPRLEGSNDGHLEEAARLAALPVPDLRQELSTVPEELRNAVAVRLLRAAADVDGPQDTRAERWQALADKLEALGHQASNERGWSRRLAADAELLRGAAEDRSTDLDEAARRYRLAAFAYRVAGEAATAAVAEAAALAAEVVSGRTARDDALVVDLSQIQDPAVSARLRAAIQLRVEAVGQVAVRGRDPGDLFAATATGSADERRELALAAREAAFRFAADSALDSARMWAETADGLLESLGDESQTLRDVAIALSQRSLPETVPILEELHHRHPDDGLLAARLADAYYRLHRTDDAIALLTSRMAHPPVPADLDTLQTLVYLLRMESHPDALRWETELERLDPEHPLLSMMPSSPPPAVPTPLLAALVGDKLQVSEDLFELPEVQQQAHLTAAIVAGTPDGEQLLRETFDRDRSLGEAVARLLGLRVLTPTQASAQAALNRGEEHFQQRRFAEAAVAYAEALQLVPDHAPALLLLGDAHFAMREYDLARAYFEESVKIEDNPQAWRFLGDAVRGGVDDVERARACYLKALELDPGYGGAREALQHLPPEPASGGGRSGEQPDDMMWGRLVEESRAGDTGRSTGDAGQEPPDLPLIAPTPVPDRAEDGHDDARSRVRLLESAMRTRGGRPAMIDALTGDDDAFERWLASSAREDWQLALFSLITLVFQWGTKASEPEHAELLARRAVRVAEIIPEQWPENDASGMGRARHLADAHAQLASVLQNLGRYDEERTHLEEAERYLDLDTRERAHTGRSLETRFDALFLTRDVRADLYDRLARSSARLGNEAGTDRYWRLAEQHDRLRPSDEMVVSDLVDGGMSLIQTGQTDRGLNRLHRALGPAEREAARQIVPRALVNVLHHLGMAYAGLGLAHTALAQLDQARDLNERTGNLERLAQDWSKIGEVRAQRPDLGDPVDAFEHALKLASRPVRPGHPLTWTTVTGETFQVSAPELAWPCIVPLARALEATHRVTNAVAILELGVELSDLVRAGLRDRDTRTLLQEQRADAFSMLTRLHALRAATGDEDAARATFDVAERGRARSLLDATHDTELLPPADVPRDLLRQERALLDAQSELQDRVPFDWERYRLFGDQLAMVWAQISGYGAQAEDYVEVRRGTPADADDVRAALGGGAVGVSYAVLDDKLAMIFLRPDGRTGVQLIDVDASAILRFVADNFGEAGKVRELATDLDALLHYLLDPLVAPLAEVTNPGEVLVLSPSGPLTNVPFHALHVDGSALLDRNPVAYLPSLSLMRTLRRRPPGLGTSAFVLGDPLGDLPYAREEARDIAARLGAPLLLGTEATVQAVLDAVPRARILHAACHARFSAEDPLASGLALSGGRLTGREILRQDWQALQLAVLSACETGVGRPSPADETLGLTRALLFAGAPALVMSLWRVPDASSAMIMSAFYDGILADVRPIDALRDAMLAARARPGGNRLDRWAGFCLIGRWDAVAPSVMREGSRPGGGHD